MSIGCQKDTLEDILHYITRSRYMTKQIWSDTIRIKFGRIADVDDEKIGENFMSNTCEMSILFPVTKKFLEEDRFEESFLEYMTTSSGFTHV